MGAHPGRGARGARSLRRGRQPGARPVSGARDRALRSGAPLPASPSSPSAPEVVQLEPAPPDSVPGSNQFTAGPALTRAGKPVLASDGHVPYTQPSSLFEIHLCGAGYDTIGI